jgi:S-adenosyl-L-methionine hydrolase (adenosine-forming)
LSKGIPPTFFGPAVKDPIRRSVSIPVWHEDVLMGKVVSVDRFGNLISNITAQQVQEFRAAKGQTVAIHIGTYVVHELVGSYSQGSRQAPSALINSSGSLEIFLQEGSAARTLQVGIGEEVRLC